MWKLINRVEKCIEFSNWERHEESLAPLQKSNWMGRTSDTEVVCSLIFMAAIQSDHEEFGLHHLFWSHSLWPTTVSLVSYLWELSNLHCHGVAPRRAASWGSPPPVSGSPAPLPAAPSSDPAEEASPLDNNAAQFRTMYWMCRGGPYQHDLWHHK